MTAREVPALDPLGQRDGGVELVTLVRDTLAAGADRRTLLFRLSRLSSSRRKATHLRLLRDAWDPLRRCARVRTFDLPNGDLAAVESPPGHNLLQAREALAAMLEDGEASAALSLLRLPEEAAAALSAVEEALGLAHSAAASEAGGITLDANALSAAERALAAADLTAFITRQWVCRIEPTGGCPEPVWEERRIALDAVRDTLLPGFDLEAAPWLRRRLRRALDRRLLADLARTEEIGGLRPLGLAPVPGSLGSPEFFRFDALLPATLRGAVTFSFQPDDILTDPDAFLFVRDLLRLRGHRLALEVTVPSALPLLPASRVGFDLVGLAWSPSLPPLGSPEADRMRTFLPDGSERVVLTGTDRPAAIAWGWDMGIRLFRGRLVERRRHPA